MKHTEVTKELARNKGLFDNYLRGVEKERYLWKPAPGKWCLLEIICHLLDEEREDFRARVRHVLETPDLPMPPIDPAEWVGNRNYVSQDYSRTLENFLAERNESVDWLRSLQNPEWENACQHPTLGSLTARMFLINWAAHDLFHIRQITRLKYLYLKESTGESLSYAGNW